jgi:hypothetical protein
MVLLGYSGARGTLIYEKNLKPKISCQTPFKHLNKDLKGKCKECFNFELTRGCWDITYS